MIFIHIILGIILGKITSAYLPFILGSVIPDIDHLFIFLKHKLWKKNILDSLFNEEKYNVRYKTPIVHSLLGLITFTIIFSIIVPNYLYASYFAFAYFTHLLLDWSDKDVKYFLYPSKIRFKGFLKILSMEELILTIIGLIVLILLFI